LGMYERYKREMETYDRALRGRQLRFYLDCQRLGRRCWSEGDALMQENDYMTKIDLLCKEELRSCKQLMEVRKGEIAELWEAREERIDWEQEQYHEERRVHALEHGTRQGKTRASRHTFKDFKEKKRVKHCKYYYEKILAGRTMVVKVELTDDERWERLGQEVLSLQNEVTHLKEIVQHRKPQQKYSLSVSKLHQVELIMEQLLSVTRKMKLEEGLGKEGTINKRFEASRVIMGKQLPEGAGEFKGLKKCLDMMNECMNSFRRLKLIFQMRAHDEAGEDGVMHHHWKSRAERLQDAVHVATSDFAGLIMENVERAERR